MIGVSVMVAFQRYLVLTPFAEADILRKVLQIRKLNANVAATSSGAIVYRDLPAKSYQDWDISELLGTAGDSVDDSAHSQSNELNADFRMQPDAMFTTQTSQDPVFVARVISYFSEYGVLLFTVELGEDIGGEAGVSGIVHVQRVVNGKITEELPPGMVLSMLDSQIEDILIAPAATLKDTNFSEKSESEIEE